MNDFINTNGLVLPTSYLPAIFTFVRMQSFSTIMIQETEQFKKSTVRNRCTIIGANGPILLTIPVQGGRGVKKMIKDIRIDYHEKWQRIHWGSIYSAYRRSPWFEYYDDKFRPFYESQFQYLLDFNFELLETCCGILNMNKKILKTDNGNQEVFHTIIDAHGKNLNLEIPYHQVFKSRHGFISNLSIVDLIFNLGPEAKSYIEKSSERIHGEGPSI